MPANSPGELPYTGCFNQIVSDVTALGTVIEIRLEYTRIIGSSRALCSIPYENNIRAFDSAIILPGGISISVHEIRDAEPRWRSFARCFNFQKRSIFLASPLWYSRRERERKQRRKHRYVQMGITIAGGEEQDKKHRDENVYRGGRRTRTERDGKKSR